MGRRVVDALAQVWRRDGVAAWVLIHLEVQAQVEADFAHRMFSYHVRIHERLDRPVLSVAILTDAHPGWRPDDFHDELWGCVVDFRFPVVKLLEYRQRRDELEASPNPFAVVVLAHLAALATREDASARAATKLSLVRRLYERGFTREQVIGLFRFIDWVLRLPEELEQVVWQQVQQEQEGRGMPYRMYIERIAMEEGRKEGLAEGREEGRREGLLSGLALALEVKFGAEGRALGEDLRRVRDVTVLEQVAAALRTATTTDELRMLAHLSDA